MSGWYKFKTVDILLLSPSLSASPYIALLSFFISVILCIFLIRRILFSVGFRALCCGKQQQRKCWDSSKAQTRPRSKKGWIPVLSEAPGDLENSCPAGFHQPFMLLCIRSCAREGAVLPAMRNCTSILLGVQRAFISPPFLHNGASVPSSGLC